MGTFFSMTDTGLKNKIDDEDLGGNRSQVEGWYCLLDDSSDESAPEENKDSPRNSKRKVSNDHSEDPACNAKKRKLAPQLLKDYQDGGGRVTDDDYDVQCSDTAGTGPDSESEDSWV